MLDNESADWHLLLKGAGNPPGNLRIQEASERSPVDHPGFAKSDVVNRHEDFIEYAERNGALVAGATDVQGEAPKFLINQDCQGKWHADGALPDSKIKKFWLIKFPRGTTNPDRLILKNEAPYYEVARNFGLRTGEPLEFIDNSLFISRFDRSVKTGQVARYGLETLASATASSSFGRYGSHLSFCQAIAKYCTLPDEEILEYLMRDILNVALRNTDNHGRNTALVKYPNGKIELSPLYDFAPMFLDPEGIARATRWDGALETVIGRPSWGKIAEALSPYVTEPEKIMVALKKCALRLAKMPETMHQCGVDDFLIERVVGRIQEICEDLFDASR
ncbi:MAG: HipA domain-containing protein [Deltaproteobacteria bacterium]|nr:HipA domain-containing protein [Deltaproteobacteria bacterium]